MSRTPVIAGNWKCNMRLDTAFELASGIRERIEEIEGIEKVVCPPFIYLATVEVALSVSSIKVGAQDTHWEDEVAATGEVGPQQLEDLCDYVIIGHSERRHQFGETDEMVNRKVKAALAVGLQPIMCVGELLEEREAGQHGGGARAADALGPRRRATSRTASSSLTSRCGRSERGRRQVPTTRMKRSRSSGVRSPGCSATQRPTPCASSTAGA